MHTKFLNMTLAAIAVCSAGLLGSCQKDELYGQEEFLSHVPENVALEEFSETSFTISWDYVNGATSYTVQLVDMDEVPTEATVYTTTNESAHAFSFSQDDIDKGTVNTVWYARVRANFPRNNYSNWVYVTYDDSDERAVLITGLGKVRIIPELSVLKTTSSSLTYEWSFTEDAASDAANSYELCLYSDEACENLVVGWTINGDDGIFSTGAGDLTRFTFSGLDAATTYYAKVRNTSLGGIVSSAVAGTTSEAGPAVTATEAGSAKAGDVIVSEEFAKVYHGGDVANCAAAYYIASDYRSENIKASGMDAENCNVTKFTANEFDVFDGGGVTAEYTQGTGLSEWAHVANAAGRSGYIKLGAGSANASLWTPELKALPAGSSTVKVSFSAKNYSERVDGSSADPGKLIVSAVAGAEISDKRVASGGTVIAQSAEIDITGAATEFQTFEVTLQNVTPDSRISIGTVEKRALIDNIVVTYVGATVMEKLSAPANVAFDQEAIFSNQLTLKWDAVENAFSYTVKWWKDGDDSNAQEVTANANSYVLEGLEPNTKYFAQVKACVYENPDYDSDYSEAVECSTNDAEIPVIPINVTLMEATSSTLTYEWAVEDDENSADYSYNVELYKDQTCSDLFVSWIVGGVFTASGQTNVRFTFSGLEAGTSYYAKITRTDEDLDPAASEVITSQTTTFNYTVSTNAEAKAGDVLVAYDFSKLIHGGDVARKAAGANGGASVRGQYTPMTGVNPTDKGTVAAWNNEFNFFNGGSVTTAYTEGTGLGDWAGSGNTSTRPGYAKIGGGKAYAGLYTPVLSTIPEGATATVKVSFSAQIYAESANFCEAVQVSAVDGVTVGAKNQASGGTETDKNIIDITSADGHFADFETTLEGVTSTSRIRIGSDESRPASENKTRFLLDNVVVTVVDVVYAQQLATPANVRFSTPDTDGELTLNWDKVDNAASYSIEYWKTAESDDVRTATAKAEETSISLTGLDATTEYSARVKAIASGNEYTDSEWSSVAKATTTTPADPTLADVTGLTVSDRDFSSLTITWNAVPNASGYKVSYNGAEQTVSDATAFTATGFGQGTDVTFSVIALSPQGDQYNSKNPATVSGKTGSVSQYATSRTTVTMAWEDIAEDRTYTVELANSNSAPSKTAQFTYKYGSKDASYNPQYYYPTRFTFTAFVDNSSKAISSEDNKLQPGTTYYVRVKQGDAASEKPWSEYVAVTTSSRSVPAGEIYFEGFDNMLMGGDIVNQAVAMNYKAGGGQDECFFNI